MAAIPGNQQSLVEQIFAARGKRWALYAVLMLIAVMVRLAAFTGISLSDDLMYSRYAQLIAQGIFEPDSFHVGLRVGVTVPVGVVYRLFGVTEWTTVLVPLLASSLTVPLLVAVGRRMFPVQAALLAGLLLATLPTHVTYATILVPEPVMELYVLLGVLVYLEARERDNRTLATLAGLCFGVAYLAKETALFVGGAFFLYSVARGNWRLALAMTGGMAVVGALEVAYYLVQTGDPLFRSHVIGKSQELYFAARGGHGSLEWRLFKAYPYMMLVPSREFAFHSLTAVVLAIASPLIVRGEKVWLLIAWAAVPILYLNFGSSSISTYEPVPLAERYIGVVYYPLLLLASAVLSLRSSQPAHPGYRIWGILLLLGLSGILGAVVRSRVQAFNAEELALRTMLACLPFVLLAGVAICKWLSVANWARYAPWCIAVMLGVAGVTGALASRNGQTYSGEVVALREILKRAQAGSFPIVRFEGVRALRWRFATELLLGHRLGAVECASRCLVIGPDAVGLPVATNVPGARAEEPLPLERIFLQ